MADIASLGISVDTRGVGAADQALDRLTKAATDATSAISRMSAAAAANSNQAGVVAKQALSAASAHSTLTAAVGKSTAAHAAHGAAMVNSRLAMMEYEHSLRAVVDGLAAGMNPLRLFAMEGGRLAQAYQMAGGASGTLAIFGGIISKLMNPTALLTGAVVGLGTAGVSAFTAWESRLNALQTSLNMLGRSTGLTLGGLNQVAMGAAGGRTTTAMSQQAVAAMAATGHISPTMMGQLIGPQGAGQQGLVQQFAQTTGVSFTEATAKMTAAFADPTKGAQELNKQFMFLNDNEIQLITSLEASGDRMGAQGRLLDDFTKRIKGAADVTSIWAQAWEKISGAASSAVSAVGGFLAPTPEMRLQTLREKIEAGRRGEAHVYQTDILNAQTLQEVIDRGGNAAVMAAMRQDAVEKSLAIADISGRAVPDAARLQSLTRERSILQGALNTPGALEGTDRTVALEAMARLDAEFAHFATSAQKVSDDSRAAAAAMMAQTTQERTAILAHKAYSDVIREGGGAALAAATSMAKWNEAIAESQKAADDQVRRVDQAHGLIGLHGLDRQIQEINQRYDELRRTSTTGPGGVSMLDKGMTALDTSWTGSLDHGTYFPPSMTLNPGAAGPWAQHAGIAPSVAAATPAGWPAGTGRGIGRGAPAVSIAGYPQPIAPMSSNDKYALAQQKEVADATKAAVDDLSDSQEKSLAASRRMLDVQISTWGKMPGEIAEATEKVKLYNDEIKTGGQRLADAMASQNDTFAKQAGQQAQDAANFQQLTSLVGSVQDMASSFTSGAASDLAMSFDKHTPIQDTLSQLSMGDRMNYYTGKLSAQQARNKVARNQIGDLARQEMFKFGLSTIEKGIMGSGSTPGLVSPIFKGIMSLFGGGLGGLFGGGGASGGGVGLFNGAFGDEPTFGFAGGGIMTPDGPIPLRRYAAGGVTSSPQAAIFGEGAGSEAYVPLPDGRSIPVSMKAPQFGGGAGVTQHYNVTGGDVVIQGNADDKVIPQLRAEMAQANKDMMAQLQRNIGTMSAKWGQRYGN